MLSAGWESVLTRLSSPPKKTWYNDSRKCRAPTSSEGRRLSGGRHKVFIDGEEMCFPEETVSKTRSTQVRTSQHAGCVVRPITVDGATLEEEAFPHSGGCRVESIQSGAGHGFLLRGTEYMRRLSAGLTRVADMLEDRTAEDWAFFNRQRREWLVAADAQRQILMAYRTEIGDGRWGTEDTVRSWRRRRVHRKRKHWSRPSDPYGVRWIGASRGVHGPARPDRPEADQ